MERSELMDLSMEGSERRDPSGRIQSKGSERKDPSGGIQAEGSAYGGIRAEQSER